MTGKSAFTNDEWNLVKDAPQWVYAALAAADGRASIFRKKKEARAFEEKVQSYKTGNALIKEILEDDTEVQKEFKGKSLAEAEEALSKIGDILDEKADDALAKELRQFLLDAGKAVAESAKEKLIGGDAISDKEEEVLNMVAVSLKATAADEQRRKAEDNRAKRAAEAKRRREAAAAKREAEAKRTAAAKKVAENRRKAKAAADKKAAEEKAAKEEMRSKMEAKVRAELEAKEKAEARKKAIAEAAEKRRAKVEARRAEAAAAAVAKAEAAAAAAAKAEEETRYYVIKQGDTLSHIALHFYGSASRWPEIFEANRDTIKKANLIQAGQRIRIP